MNKKSQFIKTTEDIIQDCEKQIKSLETIVKSKNKGNKKNQPKNIKEK